MILYEIEGESARGSKASIYALTRREADRKMHQPNLQPGTLLRLYEVDVWLPPRRVLLAWASNVDFRETPRARTLLDERRVE